MDITKQSRIIRYPELLNETMVPEMPLIIVLKNGVTGEARSLRGATAIVVGSIYYDAEDSEDEWHYRLEYARKESMRALSSGVNIKIMDKNMGKIKSNYAVDPDDPDYEEDTDNSIPIEIFIEDEKQFLYSLNKAGIIRILEREDSFIFKEDNSKKHICGNCKLKKEDNSKILCDVYDAYKNDSDRCGSCVTNGSVDFYKGGTYVDIYKMQ